MSDLSKLPALLAAQDWPRAERLLRRAAAAKGAPASVFYNLGKVLEAAGKGGQSRAWYRKAVAADPAHAHAWFELARAALDQDDWPAAADGFAAALRLSPDDTDAARNLMRVALRLGRWDQARQAAGLLDDDEAVQARYRAAAELGEETGALQAQLLRSGARQMALTTLTRTAKGRIPLRLP